MNTDLILKIGSLLFQAIQLGLNYGPAILIDLKRIWDLATSGTALTPEQIAESDAALEAAHAELRAAVVAAALKDSTE